jgi:hypothetical protein
MSFKWLIATVKNIFWERCAMNFGVSLPWIRSWTKWRMILEILFLKEKCTFHVEIANWKDKMSQGDVKYVRVLPKDKIYRNIFEAEVRKICVRIIGI